MDFVELLNAVDAAVWGPPMIILLLGCHIYTTIRTKGIQRKLPLALKLSVTKDDGAEGDVSNFGAMATSLASTLGTGSIIGVATAVLSGGPGAVLWMWLTGILGMATKYTEVFAAMKYRVKDWRGQMMGGAMHVWEQRFKRPDGTVPWWAKLAAIWFAVMACFTIFECAFTPKAAFGGAVGSGIMVALQFGCARGLFSNESGLGTAPLISSAAASKNPARQALVGMTGAFWCTVVICLMSGLVIVSTLLANPTLIADTGVTDGATLANSVFGTIPVVGTPVLMLGIICFAYSTILGWSYYGERVTTYLFGRRWVPLYIGLYICMGFLGGIGVGDVAWTATDIANALMAIPNIIMVFVMTGMVAKETQHYVYDGNIDEEYKEEIHTLEEKSAFLRKKA